MKFTFSQSIVKIEPGKRKLLIFPYYSVKPFLLSLIIIFGGLTLTEIFFLPNLEKKKKIVSSDWIREDKIIDANNLKKKLKKDWIWRSKGFAVELKAQKDKRILVMGDSFVWGSGYANMNDIWWRQLQRELNRRGYNQVEVIAAGVNGASTREQLEAARKLVLEYEPDLIIWGYVTNDPDERIIPQFFNYKLVNNDSVIQLLEQLRGKNIFPALSTQLRSLRSQKIITTSQGIENGYEYKTWELKILEGENFERYKKTIKNLASFHNSINTPGFVITLPSFPSLDYFLPRHEKVKPLLKDHSVDFYDILKNFVAKYSDTKPDSNNLSWGINPANGHPGTTSTYFYAVQAADILDKNYSDILGRKQLIPEDYPVKINDWVPYNLNPVVKSEGVVTFSYPSSEEYMLRLPVNEPFIQLNLEFPIVANEIRISGTGLAKANLYVTTINSQLQYDNGIIYPLGEQRGESITWNLKRQGFAESINTIRLIADFKTTDRQLTLTIVPKREVN